MLNLGVQCASIYNILQAVDMSEQHCHSKKDIERKNQRKYRNIDERKIGNSNRWGTSIDELKKKDYIFLRTF